jgi:hypothetical protein
MHSKEVNQEIKNLASEILDLKKRGNNILEGRPDNISENGATSTREQQQNHDDFPKIQPLAKRDVDPSHKKQTPTKPTTTKEKEISMQQDENTELKQLNIPTKNRYAVLSDPQEATENTSARESSQDLPIEMIVDSHGNGLDPTWIYRNKSFKISVLGSGKKNINGAIEHLKKITTPKHIILGVGCNNISNETPENVIRGFYKLIESAPQGSYVHILPVFKRIGESDYNRKVDEVNQRLEVMCESRTQIRVFFVKKKTNLDHERNYARDGVHFSNVGRRNLVVTIKGHLNPFLGMKPYDQYRKSTYRQEPQKQVPRSYTPVRHQRNRELPQIRDLLQQLSYLV